MSASAREGTTQPRVTTGKLTTELPAENCADKFCRYGIDGTYSFDSNTQGFTRQEWNGVLLITATCWVMGL